MEWIISRLTKGARINSSKTIPPSPSVPPPFAQGRLAICQKMQEKALRRQPFRQASPATSLRREACSRGFATLTFISNFEFRISNFLSFRIPNLKTHSEFNFTFPFHITIIPTQSAPPSKSALVTRRLLVIFSHSRSASFSYFSRKAVIFSSSPSL